MSTRVAGIFREPHIVGSGDSRILLVLPDVYSGLEGATGVTKLVGDAPAGVPYTTVTAAIRQGLVRRVKISFVVNNKRRTASLIVSQQKAANALAALTGKQYRSQRIRTAYYPTTLKLG